jgi:hypothetical protein
MNIMYIFVCLYIMYIHVPVYMNKRIFIFTGDLFITNYSTEYTNFKNKKKWISVNNKKKYKKNTNKFELNLNEKNYFSFLFFNDKTLRHNHTPYGNVVQQSVFKSIYSFLGKKFCIMLLFTYYYFLHFTILVLSFFFSDFILSVILC